MKSPALFIVFGIVLLFSANNLAQKSRDMKDWATINGTVVSASASREYHHGHGYLVITVNYAYQVEARSYSGAERMVWRGGDQATVAAEYPAGKEVAVYYDPLIPGESSLVADQGNKSQGFYVLGGALLLIGIAGLLMKR